MGIFAAVAAVCDCKRQESEKIIDEFWNNSKINNSSHIDFELFYQNHKDSIITKESWNKYFFPQLKNEINKKESEEFWTIVFETYKDEQIKYLILSLLILCGGKTNTGVQASFKKLIFYISLNNVDNRETTKNTVKTIKKQILLEILKVYTHIVTYLSLEFLKRIESDDRFNRIGELKLKYSNDNQNDFVNKLLYDCQENVDIDDFFTKNTKSLNNKNVREEIHQIYINKFRQNQ